MGLINIFNNIYEEQKIKMNLLVLFCILVSVLNEACGLGEVIFALNAGGDSFTDSFGIRYRKDHLTEGSASDYGKMLNINRVWDGDKALYETERYHLNTFGYTIPMPSGDGDYVLWLKFCEVWFNGVGLKVFDVSLNDQIVVEELDIFRNVGRGVAHDEVIAFQVRNNKIVINKKVLPFANEIRVDFLKGQQDNPKINAIIVLKGSPDQIPPLPENKPRVMTDEEDDDEPAAINDDDYDEDNTDEYETRQKRQNMEKIGQELPDESPRKPKFDNFADEVAADPYASDDTYLIPVLVAIGAFIPLLFCLCKL